MSDAADPRKQAIVALARMREQLDVALSRAHEPIAIVGMGCRFAGGATDPARFWRLLESGGDAIGEVPRDRWDVDAYYHPDPDHPGTMSTRWGGFLGDLDQFDADFFTISPREADGLDPQQRLLLEVAWETLENAALVPARLAGSASAVFLGVNANEYYQLAMAGGDAIDAYALSGGVASIAAGRISYLLGLRGPAVAVDTACSSSLYAIHLACQSLRAGECRMALAGGVYTVLTPALSIALSKAHMMAADGRCKTFDAAADGFVQGEGCGIVALKRLSDAAADGDRVLAVIRGSAANQDGRSSGLTAPSGPAQSDVVRQALADARVEAGDVGYIEAHGTGTALGDPIEVHALCNVFGPGRTRPLVVGSVKTNIGHTGPAAGVAGLIKVVLALQHRAIPAHLHFQTWNPHIDLAGTPVRIATALEPWEPVGGRRLAGVSSFGLSGTNVHLVVEEAPAPMTVDASPGDARPAGAQVLRLSAASVGALHDLAQRYRDHLATTSDAVADICATAATGRARMAERVAFEAATTEDAVAALDAFLASGDRGAAIPWDDTDPVAPHRKVELPTYPFQRRRHWLPAPPSAARSARDSGSSLLGRRIDSPLPDAQFETVLGCARFPYLADHRVHGEVVVPGAVHIALLLAAADATISTGAREIEGLAFETPLVLGPGDERPVQVALAASGDGRIYSRGDNGVWRLHVRARVGSLSAGSHPADLDVQQIRTRVREEWSGEAWRESLSRMAIAIGPSFQGLRRVWRTAGEALGEVALPASLVAGDDLHPVLLDACFQVMGAALSDEERDHTYLPVGIDRLLLFAPLPGDLLCHATLLPRDPEAQDGAMAADLRIAAGDGRIVCAVDGLRVRRVPRRTALGAAPRSADGLGYAIEWRSQPLPSGTGPGGARTACAVILGGTPDVGRDLTRLLDERVRVHVVPMEAVSIDDATADSVSRAQQSICERLIDLVRTLADGTPPPRLWIVTRGALDGTAPLHALAWGLAAAIGAEHPELRCSCVDVDGGSTTPDTLAAEFTADSDEDRIAWCDGERRVARLVRRELDAGARLEVRDTTLVTGGLGGLGLAVARHLVDRGGRHLVLVSRRPPSPEAADAVRALEARGAVVRVACADISRDDEVARLMEEMRSMPPLRGVVHAAGVAIDGVIRRQPWPAFAAGLAPKVTGALLIHRHTRDLDLDFFVMFSSLAAFVRAPGQGSYAAGNAFLDALALHRRRDGRPALSIGWGRWGEAGMAEVLSAPMKQRLTELGLRPMAPDVALAALDRALAAEAAHVVVADIDWEHFLAHPVGKTPPLFTDLQVSPPRDAHSDLRARLQEAPAAERGAILEGYLAAALRGVLRLDPSRPLDPARPFTQLGLDSLMAVELRNQVSADLAIELALAPLLSGTDLTALVAWVADALESQARDWEVMTL